MDAFPSFPASYPALHRHRLGGAVDEHVGDLVHLLSRLHIQVMQADERANAGPEVFAHVADAVFDFPSFPGIGGTVGLYLMIGRI